MRPAALFRSLGVLLITIFCYPINSSCKVVEGHIETHKDWIFLTRFCFHNQSGTFTFEFSYPATYATQSLLLYFDDIWSQAYKTGKSCKDKTKILRVDKSQLMPLIPGSAGCRNVSGTIMCNQTATFKSERERWWYIALSNCDSKQGLRLDYKLTLTNNESSWLIHFSADEFYILHVDILFLILYILILCAACYQTYALHGRHLLHATYKLFLMSVVTQFAGLAFLCGYYGEYAANGMAPEGLKMAGKGLRAISSIALLLLLVLLAKGFTVTRARLKPATSAKVAVFITLYAVIYACLFFYEQQYFDPAEVLYTYEGPMGHGLIALSMIAMCWFLYSLWHTSRLYPAKRSFFITLLVMYSVWFISLPVVIAIATLAIPKFRREKIVNAVDLIVALRAHFFFMVLTWPAKFNRIFPYHVRTTQIDAMAKTGAQTGGSTLDNFSHYQYAPSTTPAPIAHNPRKASLLRQSVTRQSITRLDLSTSHGSGAYNDPFAHKINAVPDIG